MANPYWVTFGDKSKACVEAESEAAALLLGTSLKNVPALTAEILPYPAEPRLNHVLRTFIDGSKEACPSFCYSPDKCKGRTSCPKDYACSE